MSRSIYGSDWHGMAALRGWRSVPMILLLLANVRSVSAGLVPVNALPGESPVVIHGTVGDDNSFVKRIGLIVSTPVPELIFRAADLKRVGGTQKILREQIVPTGAGKFDLAKDTPKDFEIKISGVRSPGIYGGELYFLEPGQGNTAALQMSIRVIADGSPKFAQRKGSESVMMQLVNCNSALGCTIARYLQPSAFSSSYPLQFNNGHIE